MEWEATVKRLLLADTSDLVELARIAGRDPRTFYRDANLRGARVTAEERAVLDLSDASHDSAPTDDPFATAGLTMLEKIEFQLDQLDRLPPDTPAYDWSRAQVRLGTLFHRLGLEERNAGRLHRAVEAFEAALTVQTKEDMPWRWAETTKLLADAVADIGRMSGVRDALRQSVKHYAMALGVQTRDTMPRAWAATSTSLGMALMEFHNPTDMRMLEESLTTLREVRAFWAEQGSMPDLAAAEFNLGWARLTMGRAGEWQELHKARNAFERLLEGADFILPSALHLALGETLLAIGLTGDRGTLESSLDALAKAAALQEEAADWDAWAQSRLYTAMAYRALGNFGSALDAVDDALTILTPEKAPRDYAAAIALRDSIRQNDPDHAQDERQDDEDPDETLDGAGLSLAEQIALQQAVLQDYDKASNPHSWARAQIDLGTILHRQGKKLGRASRIHGAVRAFEEAQGIFRRDDNAERWADIQSRLGDAYSDISRISGSRAPLRKALDAYEAALEIYTQAAHPLYWAETSTGLGKALMEFTSPPHWRRLNEAETVLEQVRSHWRSTESLPDMATADYNLGQARLVLGRVGERQQLHSARATFNRVLGMDAVALSPLLAAKVHQALGDTLLALADTQDGSDYSDSLDPLFTAAELHWQNGSKVEWAKTRAATARAYQMMGNFGSALDAVDDALTVLTPEITPEDHAFAIQLQEDCRRGAVTDPSDRPRGRTPTRYRPETASSDPTGGDPRD